MEGRRYDTTVSHAPEISVVIATYNRSHLLERIVSALEQQQDPPLFEVVIVDDGSSDETPKVLASLADTARIPIRVHRLERNRGPATARNIGWQHAQAPVVAFTDDDCVPSSVWLASLYAAFTKADIVQGATAHNPHQSYEGLFSWAPLTSEEGPFYETCNIGYRTSVLRRVGGFDESFAARATRPVRRGRYRPPPWGEDTDLALRAKAAGARTSFAAGAVVWHDTKRGLLRDRLADMPRRRGNVLLVRKHPTMRSSFEMRYFVEETHGFLVVALAAAGAGIIACRRPGVGVPLFGVSAISFLGWTRRRGRPFPRSTWWRVLPQWLISDVVELSVLAVSSARYRRLLL